MADSLHNANQAERDEIMMLLKKLANVSKELENNTRMQMAALNLVQAGELKRRVDELTDEQDRLVNRIVDHCRDEEKLSRFKALSRKIDGYRPQVKACTDKEELVKIKAELDDTVEKWVMLFQNIASSLMGVKPPETVISADSSEAGK